MNSQISCEQKSDVELVGLTLQDQDYFLCIVRRYEQPLSRYVRRITSVSADDAQDLLQNIFIKVYLSLNSFNNNLKFSSWIYRIAHNEVIDNYRKLKVRPQTVELNLDNDHLKQLTDQFDLLEEINRQELAKEVNEAINNLDIKSREVLLLKFIEEKDYHEISDIIRKPLGTVASRINKAKKELYKEMTKNLSYEK